MCVCVCVCVCLCALVCVCIQLDSETASAEFKLNNGTRRLSGMERDLALVKAKTQETVNTATNTQRNTEYIAQQVTQTKQVTHTP